MAVTIRHIGCVALLLGAATLLGPHRSLASDDRLDLPAAITDHLAKDAFARYWQNFEKYEERSLRQGMDRYQRSWADLSRQEEQSRKRAEYDQLDYLKRTIDNYQRHLTSHPGAANRPYVLLNLAQIYQLQAQHLRDAALALQARQKGLAAIEEIENEHPTFARLDDALYLKALLFDAMNQPDVSLGVWRQLARRSSQSLYGVHALIAVGDSHFNRDDPQRALTEYRNALRLATAINLQDHDYQVLRIRYRLAWAAYRATDLDAAIEAAVGLIRPGAEITNLEQRNNMQQDAIDLIGDALYERNDPRSIRRTLSQKDLMSFAPMIGTRLLSRYAANGIDAAVIQHGEMLLKEFPLAAPLPEWLKMIAGSFQKIGRTDRYIETLERLALLLPKKSLWRDAHQSDYSRITAMETDAEAAARLVASHYYDHGINSGNHSSFMAAAAFFRTLIEFAPQHEQSLRWRLQLAHCQYFSDRFELASRQYRHLIENFKLTPEMLQTASYQLVLAHEHLWRSEFSATSEKSNDPKTDPDVLTRLTELETAVNGFALRFPDTERAVDAILLAGAANRDHDRYDEAKTFWQRALLSDASQAQRTVAVRGMIMASMKTGSSQDVLEAAKRYLVLENWDDAQLKISTELHGVLSTAAEEESQRLNQSGKVADAGKVLVDVSQNFPQVPQREKHFRDGAYLLAIAGEWGAAQQAADTYLAEELKAHAGDMQYLRARSLEYQLRFADAASSYMTLATNFPQHQRVTVSLERAEQLAIAEGNFYLAGQAAFNNAVRMPAGQEKLDGFSRATDHFLKADAFDDASQAAARRMQASTTVAERLSSELEVARIRALSGDEPASLQALERIAQGSERNRTNLGSRYAALAGESNFALAESDRVAFRQLIANKREASLTALNEKTNVFERMLTRYNRSIDANDPEWSPRSRYHAANSAESMADEIARVLQNNDQLTNPTRQRLRQNEERLRRIAQRYHGANILAQTKDPSRLSKNPWIQRSGARTTQQSASENSAVPHSVHFELPLHWSL